ncbi:MAG: ribosome biogenesis GTPase YlqF [Eubacteriales bacterium]|nr:ribosome biogenesis GTPase YlqF [Eubacteriales bacterium]
MNQIQWYPGHMKKTRELIKSHLGAVDLVLEVCDARIPKASRSPILDELIGTRPRLILLNKSDLADPGQTKAWVRSFSSEEGCRVLALNSMSGDGIGALLSELNKIEENRKKQGTGQKFQRHLRMMIVGSPNVGKSSLINRLTKRKSAKTGDRPGVTRGKQWLTLSNGMQLLDTPGILAPKLKDQEIALHLAYCGSIRDEIMDIQDLGYAFLKEMRVRYPENLKKRYQIEDPEADPLMLMKWIAKKRGCILSGGRIDYERTGHLVIEDFRSGKLGRITLDKAPEFD